MNDKGEELRIAEKIYIPWNTNDDQYRYECRKAIAEAIREYASSKLDSLQSENARLKEENENLKFRLGDPTTIHQAELNVSAENQQLRREKDSLIELLERNLDRMERINGEKDDCVHGENYGACENHSLIYETEKVLSDLRGAK